MQTLATDEISKSYRGRRVVNGVSLRISQGEVVGLLGPNGAGKTTSFYMIVGLAPPDTGRVLLDDDDITDVPMYLRARNCGISYLPQEPSVFRKLTVEENILAVLEAQPVSWHERRERLEKLIDQLGLGVIRKNRAYALSGGERQVLALARCLAGRPSLVLLDEPSDGVQPSIVEDVAAQLQALLAAWNLTILLVEQDLKLVAALAQRVFVMQKGRITAELTPSALGDQALISERMGL